MSRTGIERGRASYAFDVVKEFMSGKNGQEQKEYRSHVKKLPSMIQVNGLGQSLAFCYGKGGIYMKIYDQIYRWMSQQYPDIVKWEEENQGYFVEQVVALNSKEYRMLTVETLALLNWMRKFADGLIKG